MNGYRLWEKESVLRVRHWGASWTQEGQGRTVTGVFQARDDGVSGVQRERRRAEVQRLQASRPGGEELVIQLAPLQGKPPHSVRTWGFTPWEGGLGSVLSKGMSLFYLNFRKLHWSCLDY